MNAQNTLITGLLLALNTVHDWTLSFYSLVPNIIAGLMVVGLFRLGACILRRSTLKYFQRRKRLDLGRILSDFAYWSLLALGLLVALTVIMPSIRPVNLVSSLGIGSLAIGFAFKDILQNWFAGLLILLRLPFRRGDQVIINDIEGTVQQIDPRATVIRTYDGRDVVVPNTTVYTSPVTIQTSQETRRVEIDFTVGYTYEIRRLAAIIRTALSSITEIRHDPPIQILCWDLGPTSLSIKVRWWIRSDRAQEIASRARAIQAIKEAFDANDIDPTDPQLIYYRSADKNGEGNEFSSSVIHHETPPPSIPLRADDPESRKTKKNAKDETLLPQN